MQNCRSGKRFLEEISHVVVELLGERAGVHGHHCLFCLWRDCLEFRFQIAEVGYGRGIIVFQCVGVKADKAYVAGRERKYGAKLSVRTIDN